MLIKNSLRKDISGRLITSDTLFFIYKQPQVVSLLLSILIIFAGWLDLTLNDPFISETCIEIKIELNFYFHTSLGAIDGKHVTIRKPSNAGSYYYNYKHTHSIILLAIAGPEYECLYADVGSNDRVNDSGVGNKSSLLHAIQNGSVKLPKDDALPNGVIAPYVFVGDDAFALKKFMMKPYPQQNLTADKRVYNYRHSRARRISENLFGILANRWRIFFTTINLEPKHVENIVLSALALHNMLIKNPAYRPGNLADTLLEDGEVLEGKWRDISGVNVATDSFYPLQIPRSGQNPSIAAKIVRDNFKDYLMNEGVVD